MHTVILTGRAEISMAEIVDYYLEYHTPERTEKVIQSLDKMFRRIALSPLSFPVCQDIKQPHENIRQAIVHNTFKVVFRIQLKEIEILEIFHATRNPELLKEIG